MKKRVFLLTAVMSMAPLAVLFTVFAQSADPWVGTWKLNYDKSKYASGPTSKSFIRKVEAVAAGLKETGDVIEMTGEATHYEATAKFDGKDYPVQGGATPHTTRAYKRIDDRSFEFVTKVDGKVTTTIRTVHTADGKTSTSTVTGKNPQGQPVNNTVVWDRQ
jgi:hypothetical protein